MHAKNPTLHGNAPDKAAVAILLIDVINDSKGEGNLIERQISQTAIGKLHRTVF